jgi:two-component system cell cycle sensor histidine kinase/response regulator CckA
VVNAARGPPSSLECVWQRAQRHLMRLVRPAFPRARLRLRRDDGALAVARLAAIVESSEDAIIGKTLDGIVESWNDGAVRMYGYDASEVVGRHISLIAPAERKGEIDELLGRLQRGERIQQFETERIGRDGRRLDVSLSLSPIRDADGTIVGASTIGRDVTEQKQAQREQLEFQRGLLELQKLESLGLLAGGVAHDFNNLLVGILGNASLALAELPPGSSLRSTIAQIELAAQRCAELTRQMLAYSGRGKFVVQPIELATLVEEMAGLIESALSKNARLVFSFPAEPAIVEADVTQLRQVVLNLITNASEALGGRPGTITISAGLLDADSGYLAQYPLGHELPEGRYAYLEVADTGSGMNAETQAKIFDPFFTTKATGRGLGLAAVQGVIRAHGGAIRVYSERGSGTSFKLILPASTRAASAAQPEEDQKRNWRGSGLVLVADDEQAVRQVLTGMLESLGFEVVEARDGAEAIAVFEENAERLRLVVLDLMMPGIGGTQALAQIERLGTRVPVILSSGYNAQELSQRLVARGIAAFLQKPYGYDDLVATIRRALERDSAP